MFGTGLVQLVAVIALYFVPRLRADFVAYNLACGAVIVAIGPSVVYDQVVSYRLAARATRGWDLPANLSIVWHEIWRQGPGLLARSDRPSGRWKAAENGEECSTGGGARDECYRCPAAAESKARPPG